MVDIPSKPVDAYVSTLLLPALANTAVPKLTEINVASKVDISCYLVTPGITSSAEQARIPDPRGCSRQDFSKLGKSTWTASAQYVENPGDETYNEAYDSLVPDSYWWVIERRGIPFDTPYAVGQLVDVYPIQAGLRVPLKESGQVLRINQELALVGNVQQNVAIVA